MSTKFLTALIVTGVISNEGDMMPPTSSRGVSDSTLPTTSTSWGMWSSLGWIRWGSDGAPAHNAKVTQNRLSDNLPNFWGKDVWPPSSPDCNPLDYNVWGACERTINRSPHNTLDYLKTSIVARFAAMPRTEITRACSRYRSRIQCFIESRGSFMEWNICFLFLF